VLADDPAMPKTTSNRRNSKDPCATMKYFWRLHFRGVFMCHIM